MVPEERPESCGKRPSPLGVLVGGRAGSVPLCLLGSASGNALAARPRRPVPGPFTETPCPPSRQSVKRGAWRVAARKAVAALGRALGWLEADSVERPPRGGREGLRAGHGGSSWTRMVDMRR